MTAITQCLATSYNIGYDTIYNICDKTQTVVPWGAATWTGKAVSMALIAGAIYFVVEAVRSAKITVKTAKASPKFA